MTRATLVVGVALWLGLNLAGCDRKPVPPQPPSVDIAAVAATDRWQTLDVELSRLGGFLEGRISFVSAQSAEAMSSDQRDRVAAAREAEQNFRELRAQAEREFLGGRVNEAVEKAEMARDHAHAGLRALGIDPESPGR